MKVLFLGVQIFVDVSCTMIYVMAVCWEAEMIIHYLRQYGAVLTTVFEIFMPWVKSSDEPGVKLIKMAKNSIQRCPSIVLQTCDKKKKKYLIFKNYQARHISSHITHTTSTPPPPKVAPPPP